MYAFLITLREGLEAALILGIVLACLARTGRRQAAPVWIGALAAVAVAAAAGAAMSATAARMAGAPLVAFEAGALLLAAAVLTYMLFWVRRQAKGMRAELASQVEAALRSGSLALAGLSFALLVREGVEVALFLQAGSATAPSPAAYRWQAIAGLGTAAAAGYAVYRGAFRLPLRAFFHATGVVLALFAAGMIANGFKKLHEIDLVPPLIGPVWDTGPVLPDSSPVGRFLGSLLGYDATPSLVQVVAYFGYLAAVLPVLGRFAGGTASAPPRDRSL